MVGAKRNPAVAGEIHEVQTCLLQVGCHGATDVGREQDPRDARLLSGISKDCIDRGVRQVRRLELHKKRVLDALGLDPEDRVWPHSGTRLRHVDVNIVNERQAP